jgi:glucosamine kinase
VVTKLLGIDIGGTTSRALLVHDGEPVARGQADSASRTAAGAAAAEQALAELLAALPADMAPVDAVCAGTAGLTDPQTRAFLEARLAPLTSSGIVRVVEDAALVLPAAGLSDGIAVICGTGSIAVGRLGDQSCRAGGWGYLLGDEGSGYWIVREALRAVLDRADRGEPAGSLTACLLRASGQADLESLHAAFYQRPQPQHWARCAPAVLDSDDPAAARLAGTAAGALTDLAAVAARRLGSPAGLQVVLAGGLMAHPEFRAVTTAAITRALPRCGIRPLTEPPVVGAVRLASEAAAGALLPRFHRAGTGHAARWCLMARGCSRSSFTCHSACEF